MDTPENRAVLEADSEAVRAYLVGIRGGAPFLSAADGRLLIRWLDGGISSVAIMAAIDRVSENRRKRRGNGKPSRGRLTLAACRKQVEKTPSNHVSTPKVVANTLAGWRIKVSKLKVSPEICPALLTLVEQVKNLPNGDLDTIAKAATQACRDFHDATWTALKSEHVALQAAATQELAALASILDEAAFASAVEAVARDQVRARFPLVSAQAVWDTLHSPTTPENHHA